MHPPFLPGGQGIIFKKKLICRKDSEIACQMKDNHVAKIDKDFYLHLIGIAAHVYADTFSHYYFSVMSYDMNDLNNLSIEIEAYNNDSLYDGIKEKAERFWEKFKRVQQNLDHEN